MDLEQNAALAYASDFHLYSAKIKEGLEHLTTKEDKDAQRVKKFRRGMFQRNNIGRAISVPVSRSEKTLGIMAQKFLMLFLLSQNAIVDIVFAAKILLGDCYNEVTECGKYKTKVRRLYDIANIFMTINLICKVTNPLYKGLKPAYKYIGPELYEISQGELLNNFYNQNTKTKHSLFDQIQKTNKKVQILPSFDSETGVLKFKSIDETDTTAYSPQASIATPIQPKMNTDVYNLLKDVKESDYKDNLFVEPASNLNNIIGNMYREKELTDKMIRNIIKCNTETENILEDVSINDFIYVLYVNCFIN
ncbi:hypothetical protein GJ496_002471 [Pomphorhynchus laevis]|nr:hypothetical protein GJ496_002471 [Pomphorhynchus laevis]